MVRQYWVDDEYYTVEYSQAGMADEYTLTRKASAGL